MTRIRKAVLTFASPNMDPKPPRPPCNATEGAEYLEYLLGLADRLLNAPCEEELQAA